MSKVICDVCGTSYPDVATQCPICGCVRTASTQVVSEATAEKKDPSAGYTYVKGGRFSKNNVRKRNASGVASANIVSDKRRKPSKTKKDNRGLVIAAIVLSLAIVAVVLYIMILFFKGNPKDNYNEQETVVDQAVEEEANVPCESVRFDVDVIELKKVDEVKKLVVSIEPADSTDELGEVISEDPAVATAKLDGTVVTITAVGPGETVIKLSCGEITAECKVVCSFEEEKTLVIPSSITITKAGDTKDIFPSDILREDIVWSSDKEAVATVSLGTVTAVSEGTATITAKYNDQVATCVVTCDFSDSEEEKEDDDNSVVNGTGGGITEDGGTQNNTSTEYKLTSLYSADASDLSLQIGGAAGSDVAYLKLVDSNGNKVSGVTWESADSSICTVSDGTVKAVGVGTVKITATYNGITYTSLIRVS